MSIFNFSNGQSLFQNLFGGMNGLGGALGGMAPKSDAQAAPGNMATAMGERSKNPWNFQNLMTNPMVRLGLGLLEQGGPQAKPHSVGQDISRAMQGVEQSEEEVQAAELRKFQLEAMRRQQEAAMRFMQDPQGFYNGGMQQVTAPPSYQR